MKVESLLFAFVRNVQHVGLGSMLIWGQFAIVVFSLVVGYGVERYIQRYARRVLDSDSHIQGLVRLVFPLTAFIVMSLLKTALHLRYPFLYLLELAGALLLALIVLRVVVQVLQITFSARRWVRQSERWVVWTVWLLFALYVTGFSKPIITVLTSVSFQYGKTEISMWDILQTVTVVACTLLISLMVSHIIEERLLRATTGDASLRVVVARLIKASFLVLAFMIALPLVGIDLTVLSVFGGALGVGLGLGLQKIASNYVSGFILLLDRSLRIGDMIEVGSEQGQVEGLTARYIILKALNGRVSLIPNDTLVSSVVINKTYVDKQIRVGVPVCVAYDTDITLAIQLMLEAVKGLGRVLLSPIPNVELKSLAKGGIDLELGFWIADEEKGAGSLISEVNIRICQSFNEKGIHFASLQQDIRLLSLPESLDSLLKNAQMLPTTGQLSKKE